jgi:hypothetical protein
MIYEAAPYPIFHEWPKSKELRAKYQLIRLLNYYMTKTSERSILDFSVNNFRVVRAHCLLPLNEILLRGGWRVGRWRCICI